MRGTESASVFRERPRNRQAEGKRSSPIDCVLLLWSSCGCTSPCGRHMSDLETALEGAAQDGIITKNKAQMLASYLGEGFTPIPEPDCMVGWARLDDAANPLEDSEAPRFLRGFHDILITIGIIVL